MAKNIKIATYNVNSIRSRLHIVIPWLERNRPDIFCMQETKVEDRKFPVNQFRRIGYHVAFSGSKGRNGVAIASLEEPRDVKFGFDAEPKDKDRLIKAKFQDLTVVNTYVPQGFKVESPRYEYKLEWFNRLRKFFERNMNMKEYVIWCGDMNVAPEEIDVHNPKDLRNHVCFHEKARYAFEMVRSMGFVDIFRKHNIQANQYTFFDYRVKNAVERKIGWRVDLILASPPLAEKSINCYIDIQPRLEERPSDHTIVVAEFELK
ncbi:MAG: exodeoxyribonuclease III [Candidatus Hydrothermarchaeota archaeon]